MRAVHSCKYWFYLDVAFFILLSVLNEMQRHAFLARIMLNILMLLYWLAFNIPCSAELSMKFLQPRNLNMFMYNSEIPYQ